MPGKIASTHAWHWTVWGKHPVGKDYIHLNPKVPLLKAFSDWVEKGYQTLISNGKDHSHPCSWRFWAQGAGKETLVCGVCKDSSDSIGRPYPFLIMGTGPLQGWKNQWDLLPFACENTWRQIEDLSMKRFKDVKQLTGEVSTIGPPCPHWTEFMSQRGDMTGVESASSHKCPSVHGNIRQSLRRAQIFILKIRTMFLRLRPSSSLTLQKIFHFRTDTDEAASWGFKDIKKKISDHIENREFIIPLHDGQFDTPSVGAAFWHQNLKSAMDHIPNVVFLGGIPGKPYLAVFKRPLTPHDFVRLWAEPGL